jgi:hypothetical protein
MRADKSIDISGGEPFSNGEPEHEEVTAGGSNIISSSLSSAVPVPMLGWEVFVFTSNRRLLCMSGELGVKGEGSIGLYDPIPSELHKGQYKKINCYSRRGLGRHRSQFKLVGDGDVEQIEMKGSPLAGDRMCDCDGTDRVEANTEAATID